MCYKEFFGYSCGHCSLPVPVLCPLTSQDPSFPSCPIKAERVIPLDRLCTGCHRAQFNIDRIQFENEHALIHELGHCSLFQCGTAYTVEEIRIVREQDEAAKEKQLQCRQAHENEQQKDVELSFAFKRAIDASAQSPQVSAQYGMVSELDVTNFIEAPGIFYQAAPAIMDKPDAYNEASGPSYQPAPASDPLPMTASNAPRGGGNHRWNDARRNYHGNGGRFQQDPHQQDPYQQNRNQHGRNQQGH